MTTPQPRYQPGERIADRYLVHDVKMGGMGEVYLCLDLEEMYPFALKTFQQRYQSDALRQAFETEVTTWVALEKHPNIVRCFYMDTLDNQPFMILEWVGAEPGRGTDLRSHLRYGPMDLGQSLPLILDICYGLQHAQDKQPGLVHRDLKPENILVTQGGQAKITDFGLAHVVAKTELLPDDDEMLASPGQTMISHKGGAGTPSYMAPEQWRGETLDQRTDIYALGCIWVELLTGQPPFSLNYQPSTPQEVEGWLSEMQRQHEQAKRPDLSADISTPVNNLIEACLSQNPAKRPAHLANLIEKVQGLYQSLLNKMPPPPPVSGVMTSSDYNSRGATYQALRQTESALADFKRAISLDPSYADAYYNRGTTYASIGQFDNALADYTQAIIIKPHYAKAYYNRGNAHVALRRTVQALADFTQAIAFDPSDAAAYSNRGLIYSELGQTNKALADYTEAISLEPNHASAYLNMGVTYGRDLGDTRRALFYFEKASQLGDLQASKYAVQARHRLGQKSKPVSKQVWKSLDAFAKAASIDEMRQVVGQHPILLETDFIKMITQAITKQILADQQPAYQQRLTWLQQIILEQAQ